MFTRARFPNKTYSLLRSPRRTGSLSTLSSQMVTKTILESLYLFFKCGTESRKTLHNLEARTRFTAQWELSSKARDHNTTHKFCTCSALSLNVQIKAISKPTLILWHLDHFNAWEQCSNVCDLFLSSWILNTLVGSYL